MYCVCIFNCGRKIYDPKTMSGCFTSESAASLLKSPTRRRTTFKLKSMGRVEMSKNLSEDSFFEGKDENKIEN